MGLWRGFLLAHMACPGSVPGGLQAVQVGFPGVSLGVFLRVSRGFPRSVPEGVPGVSQECS